jgi:HAD superfamily hydrolase (TIGR01490 family)
VEEVIKPIQLKPAIRLINKHRFKGDTVLVITATNRFVTEPIVKLFRIDNLLATTPEFIDGRYTGQFEGIPCFQEGKVKLLEEWLKTSPETMENSWFYSDSYNDLPLLKLVDNPVAVDPDDKLRDHAEQQKWSIISLRL